MIDLVTPPSREESASVRMPSSRRRRRPSRSASWALVFLAPSLIAIVTMRIWPAIGAAVSSLQTSFPGGLKPSEWAGLDNYGALAADPLFWQTIVQTLVFNLVVNPLQVVVALMIAFTLTRRVALRGLWRTLVFVPATIPIVGSSIAWSVALQPKGPINALITGLAGSPQPFLTSPAQALATIMLIVSWIGVGYWMIFLIAGIESIPGELYEAATIDRAGPLRTFFAITIPLLKRPLLFVLVADTVANFVLFVPIQLLTDGGPQNSTTMLMFSAYRTTYGYGSSHAGAAQVVILTALQFLLLRDRDGDHE
jgi:multiple sugar transport system permease protein